MQAAVRGAVRTICVVEVDRFHDTSWKKFTRADGARARTLRRSHALRKKNFWQDANQRASSVAGRTSSSAVSATASGAIVATGAAAAIAVGSRDEARAASSQAAPTSTAATPNVTPAQASCRCASLTAANVRVNSVGARMPATLDRLAIAPCRRPCSAGST